MGRDPSLNSRIWRIFLVVILHVLKKKPLDLCLLVFRPLVSIKEFSPSLKYLSSWTQECHIGIVSSTYYWCFWGWGPWCREIPLISWSWLFALKRCPRPSTIKIKRKGERVSPWLISLDGWKVWEGVPFIKMEKKNIRYQVLDPFNPSRMKTIGK